MKKNLGMNHLHILKLKEFIIIIFFGGGCMTYYNVVTTAISRHWTKLYVKTRMHKKYIQIIIVSPLTFTHWFPFLFAWRIQIHTKGYIINLFVIHKNFMDWLPDEDLNELKKKPQQHNRKHASFVKTRWKSTAYNFFKIYLTLMIMLIWLFTNRRYLEIKNPLHWHIFPDLIVLNPICILYLISKTL